MVKGEDNVAFQRFKKRVQILSSIVRTSSASYEAFQKKQIAHAEEMGASKPKGSSPFSKDEYKFRRAQSVEVLRQLWYGLYIHLP